MPWTRIALAILASGVVSSMTDWLFMGDWLYKRFDKHPEIWKFPGGTGETKAIMYASVLPFLTCGIFVIVCAYLHVVSLGASLKFAFAVWLIGPLPMTIANSLFMKLTPAVAASHTVGWLVKLVIAAASVALFLS